MCYVDFVNYNIYVVVIAQGRGCPPEYNYSALHIRSVISLILRLRPSEAYICHV